MASWNAGCSAARWGLTLLALAGCSAAAFAEDWPQWLGPQRDGVWRETGILQKFPAGGPKVLWRTPLGGGYAGPAVAAGRVYVMDRQHDAGTERVLCLDEKTGKELWKHEYACSYAGLAYPAGPRCTPTVVGDKVYALGAMGRLMCLDAQTGKVLWEHELTRKYQVKGKDFPRWGYSAHPLVDGDKLYCLAGGQGSIAVAFDRNTGKELWRALSASEPGYCPPMIYEFGGRRQLIIWHPDAVNGLDPETGKVLWSQPFQLKAGLSIPTPRKSENRLFLTAFYDGPLMLQFNQGESTPAVAWKGKGKSEVDTDGLHSIMPTPVIKDGHIYGVCSYGQLRCLKEATGERLWETYQATSGQKARWGNAFLTPNGDRFFLFSEKGDLIIARLTPKGYEELDRAHLLKPTGDAGFGTRRAVVWSHPAYANKCAFVRNDEEIICVSLAE